VQQEAVIDNAAGDGAGHGNTLPRQPNVALLVWPKITLDTSPLIR
jgi:hypothetical protein